jgi:hypothetical protein
MWPELTLFPSWLRLFRNCKARKVKCGEEKPRCSNCERLDEDCDYKIRLSWGGRPLKKKLQENGGTHDPNGDDQSQFIPGAGQFSLNQHFPSPQTFIQATPSPARKPAVPRANSSKKTGMSGYQTVFAVGENMPALPASNNTPPPPPPTSMSGVAPIATTAPLDPSLTGLTVQIPIAQAPRPDHGASRTNGHSHSRSNSLGWNQTVTPTTAAPSLASPFDEYQMRADHDRAYFSPYSSAGPFSPTHVTSPLATTSFHHSPRPHSSSPEIPHTRAVISPQQHKNTYHHPRPSIITSPPKKARTSTSPTAPPPMSPYIYGPPRHAMTPMTSAPQLTASLAEVVDFMNTPVSVAPMTSMSMAEPLMDLPAVTGINMSSNVVTRRVSVESLMGAYNDGYGAAYDMNFKPEEPSEYTTNNGHCHSHNRDHGHSHDMDDDDVEEISRNEFEDNNFSMQVNNARRFFGQNSAYPDQMSIPRRLDPLPQWLLSNDQNKMYFHHYLKHTARLLVPHDCSENPFKHILPQSA